jgi:hypothetical protein
MDKALQEYYEARFEMMSSQGWLDFIEDVESVIANYEKVLDIKDAEELFKRKGQLDILYWIVNLKRESETAWEQLNV